MTLKFRTLSRLTTLGIALALLITLAVGWAVKYALDEAARAADWVVHSLEVQRDLENVKTDLRTAQAMARGHTLFGDGETLEHYRTSLADLHRQIAAVRALTADNPAQQRALDELVGTAAAYSRYLERLMELRRTHGLDAARREFVGGAGHPLVVEAVARIDAMVAAEDRLLSERRAALARSNAFTGKMVFLAWALVLAILVASVVALRREIRRRQAAEQEARALNEGLEEQVAERTAALKNWEAIFQSAGWGVVVVDLQAGRVVAANPSFSAMLHAQTSPVGRPLAELFAPEERAALAERAGQVETLGHLRYESVWLRDDGSRFPVEIQVAGFRDEAGRLFRAANVQDISERRQAEQALREAHDIFRELVLLAADYFWELDENFRFRELTAAARIGGRYAWQTYIGKARWEMPYLGMDETKWARHRADLDAHRPFRNIEMGLASQQGEERWFLVGGDPVFDKDGRFTGYRGVSVDITERKLNEKQREVLLERIGHILESISDGFVALDRDWRYTYVNAKAGELFGRGPASLVGKHIWAEFPEGVGQPFQLAYERAMATGNSEVIEDYYAPWDRWFENRIYPSAEGVSIFFHEITERKQAERQLAEYARQLAELSRRLLQAQEDERRAIARELHDEIGQALTAIKLGLAALRRRVADEEGTALLADSLSVIDQAIAQVRDRSLDLRPPMLDDIGLAGTLEWLISRLAAKVSLRITADIAPLAERPAPEVESAAFRIAQEALTNVLRHAGAGRAELRLWQEDGLLCLGVKDDGAGFDPQARKAGFGLSGMRERALLLGGDFMLESYPGKGTEVRARLPFQPKRVP